MLKRIELLSQSYFKVFVGVISMALVIFALLYGGPTWLAIPGLLGVVYALYMTFSPYGELHSEAAAYGESVRASYELFATPYLTTIQSYAIVLSTLYGLDISTREAGKLITKKAENCSLI